MKMFKKSIALAMALLLMVTCLAGCGESETVEYDETAGFTIQLNKPAEVSDEMWEEFLVKIQSWSKVPIHFEFGSPADAGEALALQMAAGDFPEVILSNLFNASEVSKYAANGILIPLDEYITPENTPNIWKMFEDNPTTKAANYLPDGKMYSLPQLKEFGAGFLERAIFINKVWLDKLGLEVPKTTEELKEVLRAFKTQDPNGNGKADEIPLTFLQGHAFLCPEALLSAWGYATKSGVYDSYTTVKDGKVYYAPMLDEWREMVRYYRDLYAEGLLDMEAFTQTPENMTAKQQSETSVIGVIWSPNCPMANKDEYIAIAPIHAEGYETVWQIHPGIIGNRNVFSITTACKNPKAVMNWIDHFYELENTLEFEFGILGHALNEKNEEGKYTWNQPPEGMSLGSFINENRPLSSVPCYIPEEVYGNVLELNADMKNGVEIFKLYEPYLTSEPWPRPYYSPEDSQKLSELQTDIFTHTNEKMAKWIIGSEDVETGWDAYIEDLKKMGVETLIEINQKTYDNFQNAMK